MNGDPEWTRQFSAAMRDAGFKQQVDVADFLGVGNVTVNRWLLEKAAPRNPKQRKEYLRKLHAHRPSSALDAPPLALVPISPRFTTEAERTAHVAGILTMANLNNDQVKACVQAALDALLAPLSGPTRPTDDEAPPSLRAAARETGTRLHPPAKRAR